MSSVRIGAKMAFFRGFGEISQERISGPPLSLKNVQNYSRFKKDLSFCTFEAEVYS